MVRLGKLSRQALSEEEMDASQEANQEQFPILSEQRIENVFYHSMAEMLIALDAGQIDNIAADEPTVQYVLSLNGGYAENHPQVEMNLEYSLCFQEGNAALRDSYDAAITAMREDGTLDKLAETAKRLEHNVELMQINSGARTLALSSGRAGFLRRTSIIAQPAPVFKPKLRPAPSGGSKARRLPFAPSKV